MKPLQTDLSILEKFKFKKPPVGVKFEFFKPEGVEKLETPLALCAMIKEAQERGKPFYFTKDEEDCFGKVTLGMDEIPRWGESGQFGPLLEIFQDARANTRLYQYLPKMPKDTVNYVVLSPLDTLTFEPDLLIFMTTARQAEILLRAMSYSTGELWETKKTGVLGCAWLYVYPYQSGKVNYVPTGMSFGMIAGEVFEEGWILLSIPYNWIPTIVQNLKEMKWVLPSYSDGREKAKERGQAYMEELEKRSQNP